MAIKEGGYIAPNFLIYHTPEEISAQLFNNSYGYIGSGTDGTNTHPAFLKNYITMIDFFTDDTKPKWNKGDIVGKNIIVGFNSDENGVEVAILKRLSRYKVIRRFQVWWYKNI